MDSRIAFPCPNCQQNLKIKNELAGKKVRCPRCQQPIRVPEPAASATPIPATLPSPPASPGEPPGNTAPPELAGEQAAKLPAELDPSTLSVEKHEQLTQRHQPQPGKAKSDSPPQEEFAFLATAQSEGELGRLGRYRVLEVLGKGGMGVVFRAEDPQLQRQIALKVMLPALAGSADARQRFLREARAAAAVEHDHIVSIFEVGEDRGVPFLAMPLLRGETLDERLSREGKLPLEEVLRIGREVALGLAAAHQRGLVHRDIKPANLWLEQQTGRVKILDFGLVRPTEGKAQLTQDGAIVGTPAYMSPEQARGEAVDAGSDLFSLGCVLYRLATGEAAFKGNDTISTLLAVVGQEPTPPQQLNPELPGKLAALILQLLSKERTQRPGSAQIVADTLRRIAKEEFHQSGTDPQAERGSGVEADKRTRRNAEASREKTVALVCAGVDCGFAERWSGGGLPPEPHQNARKGDTDRGSGRHQEWHRACA